MYICIEENLSKVITFKKIDINPKNEKNYQNPILSYTQPLGRNIGSEGDKCKG